jgi:chemotaxis regulatin CheY-phosphate phosphatase CheZ
MKRIEKLKEIIRHIQEKSAANMVATIIPQDNKRILSYTIYKAKEQIESGEQAFNSVEECRQLCDALMQKYKITVDECIIINITGCEAIE